MTVHSIKSIRPFAAPAVPVPFIVPMGRTLRSMVSEVKTWLAAVPAQATTAEELFELAAAYEATQPGYAADLRAAANLAKTRHFGR